jgi:peptide/nickel transport system substrate-binding protein
VKWNIERYLNDKTSRRASEINFIQTVDVVDDSTVKFNLKAAFSPLLANLVDRAGMMVSQKAAEAGGADFTRKPVGAGTGPFKFVEWVSGDHITLERNTSYWKKGADGQTLPYLDKITYRAITDETVRLTNLKTGDLDADFNVPAKDYATTKSSNEFTFQEAVGLSFNSIYVNTQAEPFNKKEFRQAIAYLLDRDQIVKTIFFDLQKVGYGPIPPTSWAYDSSFKPYSVDVNKAKELLKAGGKPDGFTFEMKIGAGNPVTLQLTQLIKDQLAKAGIIMNITQLEAAKTATDAQAGNFQAEYYGWSGRIDPDGNIYNQMRSGGSLNDGKYSNPQVDDLLDKARASSDQNERKSLYQQAQKLIVDDAPFIFYSFGTAVFITRPAVQNVKVYSDQIMRFEAAWLK